MKPFNKTFIASTLCVAIVVASLAAPEPSVAASNAPVPGTCSDAPPFGSSTSSSFNMIAQCTIVTSQSGQLFISASTGLTLADEGYRASATIDIDATTGDLDTVRWSSVYKLGPPNPEPNGTSESLGITALKPVAAGTHTVYFLLRRVSGTGTVTAYRPTLSVIFITNTASEMLTCSDTQPLWGTTAPDFQTIASCSITTPQSGSVLLFANGSLDYFNGEYEARFRLGVDESTSGEDDSDRWANVYNGAGGNDTGVVLSLLKPITSGTHSFYFLGRRYDGGSIVTMYNGVLNAIFIPSSGTRLRTCDESIGHFWNSTSTLSTFEDVTQCTITLPEDGWLYVTADASAGYQDATYGAQFVLNVDRGSNQADRYTYINSDLGDGRDRVVALSMLQRVSAGNHTIYLQARRYPPSSTMIVYDPTLSVLFIPGSAIYLPLVLR